MARRLIITIDGREVDPKKLGDRYEDFLVRNGLNSSLALGLNQELVKFLDGYEDGPREE